ncbi:lysophospholipid acyltransferase family protein [Roseomonas sp. SSH11]|uniref:Lysophospholipid acyltransferase family protein n=1 Tax=Pararoseomonas baculiformis TaxID=2820812 RepID=A0ABS4ABT3_9PROT|nr:lysophospholipid acyltransferase family protein [Pararoseomonas baculiformis]MBP0444326.1 lysophospholipid acyltransferase family protein [Pararoseomonas baculiformis]
MAEPSPLALRDARLFGFFHFVFARFFRRHMGALRMPPWGFPQDAGDRPLIVLANHPSWWDGVAFMLLPVRLLPHRHIFIPMEAAALAKYPFMRRLGVFGIEPGPRGAVAFLRTAKAVLASPGTMLWMNAPGRFQDVRERPVAIAPGVSRLPEIAPDAIVLPLALDYVFWTERRPDMLAAFGPPLPAAELLALDREAREERIREALTGTMDRLTAEALTRDPARFTVVAEGAEGMGGIYDLWRHVAALARGRRFNPRHAHGTKSG